MGKIIGKDTGMFGFCSYERLLEVLKSLNEDRNTKVVGYEIKEDGLHVFVEFIK